MIEIKTFSVGYLSTNCYVVMGESDKAVIIDAGGGYKRIKEYLDGINKKAVAVLCTHGHFDHVLDINKWKEIGATIYIHGDDIPFITGEQEIISDSKFDFVGTEPDVILHGGEEISVGDIEFKVIHTPGHSMGSVCYKMDDKCIFVGDTIFFHSYGRTDFYGGDFTKICESVKRLISEKEDIILYPGHGENTTVIEERIFNPLASYK